MRKAKYYKFMGGLCLKTEKEFFGVNAKPYKILEAMTKYNNLSDDYLADKLCMNKRTYQRHKAYLVMVGALQVRQLNATTYVYCLGEEAIAKDDKTYEDSNYKKIVSAVVNNYSLIDDDKIYQKVHKEDSCNAIELLKSKQDILDYVYYKYPMPTTDEVISSM